MSSLFHFPMLLRRGPHPDLRVSHPFWGLGMIAAGETEKVAPLFRFRRCRPAVSSGSHICPDVWLPVDTDQLFLRTKGCLREGKQKEAPQSTSSLASTTPFSNAGSSSLSTEGQLVSCLWPGMGALRKWQAVFKAKSSAPVP